MSSFMPIGPKLLALEGYTDYTQTDRQTNIQTNKQTNKPSYFNYIVFNQNCLVFHFDLAVHLFYKRRTVCVYPCVCRYMFLQRLQFWTNQHETWYGHSSGP